MLRERVVSPVQHLSERTLHRAMKGHIWNRTASIRRYRWQGLWRIYSGTVQLLEVQTGSVTPLVKKLLRLPKEYPVTIVLPIVREKTLVTLSEEGELLSRRRSPKKGGWWEAYYQRPGCCPRQSVRVCGCG